MSQLFQRQVRVIADAVEIRDLRCAFKVKKDDASKPNTAEIIVTNLAQKTRSSIDRKGAPLIIQAGYSGSLSTIFSGVIRTVDHMHDGPNWHTSIKSGDGERRFQFATISNSYAAGTPVRAVLMNLLDSLELDASIAKRVVSEISGEFVNGYTAHGKSARLLDEILGGLGFVWSIQDGRVQVLEKDQPTTEEAVVLSPSTGLIGSPQLGSGEEQKKQTGLVKLKSLLQARFKPGGKVLLKSDAFDGVFRIVSVQHTGDTHGGDWVSEVEAVPSDAKVAG